MKTESAELAGQVATQAGFLVASVAVFAGKAIEASMPEQMLPAHAFFIATAASFLGAVLAVGATEGWPDKLATGAAALTFGLSLGTFTGELFIAELNARPLFELSAIGACSFAWALLGWPLYVFVRRILSVSGENIDSIGAFFAALAKAVSGRK